MNEQAEEILLGTILKENTILDELVLSPEHFLDMANQQLYRAMLNIKCKGFPIDGASIKNEIGETGFMFLGGNSRLVELKNCVASIHAFKSYEQIIISQWKIHSARELMQSALHSDMTVESVQALLKDLARVDEEGIQEEFNLKEHLQKMYELVTVETPKRRSGIPSGYAAIDNRTDGFQPNDLIIIGARPSMGKTAFLLNLALNAHREVKAIPVIFSLEMSAESLIKRMMSCICEINGLKLKNPYHYLNESDKEKWINHIGVLEKITPYIYDKSGQKVSEMRAKLRKIKQQHPDQEVIVFIDYLTLIKPTRDYNSTHAQITEISADLKAMAKDFKCPVVCLAQLNRSVEQRQDKRPLKSDLRESGSIEQDADVIAMLYRDEYYNPNTEDKNVLEVDISKNRDGEVGVVKLTYYKEINKIVSFKG